MCGIAGIIGEGSEAQLKTMVERIHHRGPDDDGFLIDTHSSEHVGAYMGMRRLAIIDVAGGKQPLYNADKSIGVVFNGEIYNFHELRRELEHEGYQFNTNTDTEVIVYLYEKYSFAAFEKLAGMFAIAIWDANYSRLVLVRDRAGEKPLYYAEHEGTIYFASELKVFESVSGLFHDLNQTALVKFIDQSYVGGSDSIFSSIHKLSPGSYLVFEKGNSRIERYWELPQVSKRSDLTFDRAVHALDALLSDTVKAQLVSDVPLGVFLSGGIDSSLVTYYAQQHLSHNVKTFTVMFDDESFNEAPFASIVAEHLGTDHTVEHVSDEQVLSIIDSLPEILDEPFADSSIIPTYWLSKMTRKHVTVALGGDGGDELFMGYQTFQAWDYWKHMKRQPAIVRKSLARLVSMLPSSSSYFSLDFKLKRSLLNFDKDEYNQHFRWFSAFSTSELGALFDTDAMNVDIDDYIHYKKSWPAEHYRDPIMQSAHLYQTYYLPDDVFTKVDRASMSVSLETRAPLVNHELMAFVNSLPTDYKIRNGETKYILKKLAERYLPKEIVYRPKHGFPSPVDAWLRGPLKEKADALFARETVERLGLLNAEIVQKYWIDFLRGNHYRARQIWTLFIWQLWSEYYVK